MSKQSTAFSGTHTIFMAPCVIPEHCQWYKVMCIILNMCLRSYRLAEYHARPRGKEPHMEALLANMSTLEKRLVDTQDIVRVRGKRGRAVPIIIPPNIQHVLALIVDNDIRAMLGLEKSQYVFANFSKSFFLKQNGS